MSRWHALLEDSIKKLTAPLKDEDAIIMILKRRLTKKEFKILKFMVEDVAEEVQRERLSLDEKRYQEVKTRALKKINFHDLKEELMQEEV
jgi:predicted phosphoribosyltransferase